MSRRRTIRLRDIAKESRASLTTVSLVLNRRDEKISDATRQRVREAVERLGYRPSRLAQGLQAQRTGILAVLVPDLQHAFADVCFGELISAVHDHAASVGNKLLLEVAHPDYIASGNHLELFDRDYCDGVLCMGVTNKDRYLRDFSDGARPMIVINNYVARFGLNYVCCDYRQAGVLVADHMLSLGHRGMAMIHGAPEVQTAVDLQDGFHDALRRAGVHLTGKRLEDGMCTAEGGALAAITLMKRDPSITAILAGNDKMAIGALSGLKQYGLSVPRDVSVVGCDDIHAGAFTDPPLTTVHTPLHEIGRRACRRLLELIETARTDVREVHRVKLTLRKSTCGPRTP